MREQYCITLITVLLVFLITNTELFNKYAYIIYILTLIQQIVYHKYKPNFSAHLVLDVTFGITERVIQMD